MAAWRQWHAPDPARVAETLARIGAMSWRDFSSSMEQSLGRQGYTVTRLNNTAADFRLVKGGRVTLLGCKRWKAASTGVDALRELVAAKEAQGADETISISLGQVSETARRFAKEQGIHLMSNHELVQLLLEQNRP